MAIKSLPFGGVDANREGTDAPRAREVETEPGRRLGDLRGCERCFGGSSGRGWSSRCLDMTETALEAQLYGEAGAKDGRDPSLTGRS